MHHRQGVAVEKSGVDHRYICLQKNFSEYEGEGEDEER